MLKKLQELQERLPKEHKDLPKFVQHVFEELDSKVNKHIEETAILAHYGSNPDRIEEETFRNDVTLFKGILVDVLTKTVIDIENKGKKVEKHFSDGVDQ